MAWQPNQFVSYVRPLATVTHCHMPSFLLKIYLLVGRCFGVFGGSWSRCWRASNDIRKALNLCTCTVWVDICPISLNLVHCNSANCTQKYHTLCLCNSNMNGRGTLLPQFFRILVTPKVSGGHLQRCMVLPLPTVHLLRGDIVTRHLLLQWEGINTKELLLRLPP